MSYKTDKNDPEYKRYTRYIASKEFKEIKNIVLERYKYTCACCSWHISEYDPDKKSNKRTLQVHHRTYEHLYDEKNHLEDLIVICSVCHRAIHAAPSNIHRFQKSLDTKLNDKQ